MGEYKEEKRMSGGRADFLYLAQGHFRASFGASPPTLSARQAGVTQSRCVTPKKKHLDDFHVRRWTSSLSSVLYTKQTPFPLARNKPNPPSSSTTRDPTSKRAPEKLHTPSPGSVTFLPCNSLRHGFNPRIILAVARVCGISVDGYTRTQPSLQLRGG